MHHVDHLFPHYPERRTGGNGAGRGQMQRAHACERLFSNEFSGDEKRDGGLLPVMRNDGEFCAARLKIEDGVSGTSLRKEGLPGLQLDNSTSYSSRCQKGSEVEGHTPHLERYDWWTG